MASASDCRLKVVLVEDSLEFGGRMEDLLNRTPGIQVRGRARSASEAVRVIADVRPHVVLLDIFLADGANGMDVLREAKRACPDAVYIAMTNEPSQGLQQSVLALGAKYFFDKATGFFDIGEAVRALAAPGIFDPDACAANPATSQ